MYSLLESLIRDFQLQIIVWPTNILLSRAFSQSFEEHREERSWNRYSAVKLEARHSCERSWFDITQRIAIDSIIAASASSGPDACLSRSTDKSRRGVDKPRTASLNTSLSLFSLSIFTSFTFQFPSYPYT